MKMIKRKPRILFVDDDKDLLYDLGELLKVKGFEVYTALSKEKAIEIASQIWLDLAIIDIRLIKTPSNDNKSGFDLALELDPMLPKIFITAYEDFHLAVEAQDWKMRDQGNVRAFVPKASSPEEIIKQIWQALNKVNFNLHIDWGEEGEHSARMLIDMLKGYKHKSEEEKKAAEEELENLFCRAFNEANSVLVVELRIGKGGCGVARVRPKEKKGEGRDVIIKDVIMKFGSREKIEKEWSNYNEYELKYVPHGATVVEGFPARTLHLGAIKYSFVGGAGIAGSFSWYYRNSLPEDIIETLNFLFEETCGMWYRNSRTPQTDEECQPLDLWYRSSHQLNLSDSDHVQELKMVLELLLREKNWPPDWRFELEGEKYLRVTQKTSVRLLPNSVHYGLRNAPVYSRSK